MYHDLPRIARFWSVLRAIDQDLSETARRIACPCRGRLHSANPGAPGPRGTRVQLAVQGCLRLSFCCDRDRCRKRVTPLSVRFLGPKVYLGAVIILISARVPGTLYAITQAEARGRLPVCHGSHPWHAPERYWTGIVRDRGADHSYREPRKSSSDARSQYPSLARQLHSEVECHEF
jgi:hypothetical protein